MQLRPVAEYAWATWGAVEDVRLDQLQHAAAQIIMPVVEHRRMNGLRVAHLSELGLQPLWWRRLSHTLQFWFRISQALIESTYAGGCVQQLQPL